MKAAVRAQPGGSPPGGVKTKDKHAPNCDLNNARDDPSKWWPAALAVAKLNAPLGAGFSRVFNPKCPECGGDDYETRQDAMRLQILRNEWLKVARAKGGPTKEDVREICQWLIRWGIRPDNFWLHFAGIGPDGLPAPPSWPWEAQGNKDNANTEVPDG